MEWSKLRQTVAGNSLAIQAGGDVTTGPVINVNANTIELKPGMDREAVAGIAAQVLSTMMQEVRANPKLMLHLLQGDTTTASASSVGDPFAHLRAQLAE